MKLETLLGKPIVQMSGEEFFFLIREGASTSPQTPNRSGSEKYVYLETISGFLELLDEEKLQKLDKLDSLDDMSSIKTKQDALEAKLTAVDQKMSEFVKPEDFRLTGVEDVQVYNIRVKDDKAVHVTMRCKNTHKKKKGDSDYSWVEVIPIVAS